MFLNCHSYYSLRHGAYSVERLVEDAKSLGIESLALTDIHSMSGLFDFLALCQKNNIHPAIGMEFRSGAKVLYIALAKNDQGIREINEHLSRLLAGEISPTTEAPEMEHCYIIYPFESRLTRPLRECEYFGVKAKELSKALFSNSGRQIPVEKMVAWLPVNQPPEPDFHRLHRLLRAIDLNTLVTKLPENEIAAPEETLLSPEEARKQFSLSPKLPARTESLLQSCSYDLDLYSNKNKKTFTGSKAEDRDLLLRLTEENLPWRYSPLDSQVRERLSREMDAIFQMDFCAYFLITLDIIHFAKSKGFHHIGRGSGANSVVAYILGITDVDPIELDLYFERFINRYRQTPPDFDIDFSWDERDVVTDYIFKRHGRNHVALLATVNTFKYRSVIRELAKTLGLPKREIDALVENPDNPGLRDKISKAVLRFGSLLQDFPNYLSIHAGGILITEKPITFYTPLQPMPKGFPTTQWDMYVAEEFGFHKYDILSQRGLGHIKDAAELIRQNQGISIDVHDVQRFKTDQKVKEQLRSGETTGCFYVESPATRGLLKKLRCDDYITLVAASSIIRPGVAQSGMMREYIYRYNHPGSFEYIHPVMEEQLKETFGVMVFQEDVLKVCHHYAGIDLEDADVIRRAMSGKYRSKDAFERIKTRFFENSRERGHPEAITAEVWRQIESFAGYSFAKGHSASYAVESFQSLYLKTYFPLEFMVAVINNFGGFYRTEIYVHEARKAGGIIEAPCVNQSFALTSLSDKTVWLGLGLISGLETELIARLKYSRSRSGHFLGLEDFVNRVNPGLEQLHLLIRVGAFRFTRTPKKELLWQATLLFQSKRKVALSQPLFSAEAKSFQLPPLNHSPVEDAWDEMELLGFPVQLPFDLLQTNFRGEVFSDQMSANIGKIVRMLGYLVTTKYVHTRKKEEMRFATFLDAKGAFFDTTHFPDVIRAYPFQGIGVYLLLGKIVEEFGYATLEVKKMAKMPYKPDPRLFEKKV